MNAPNQIETTAAAAPEAPRVKRPLEDCETAIGDAMILIGNHASKDSDLGREIDEAWEKLDSILQSIKDGNYSEKGEFIA